MDPVTKALYDSYPMENKSDFFSAYVYMKYIDDFLYHAIKIAGQAPKDRTELPEAGIDELIEAGVQRIAETALSLETSFYHGKVVKIQDAVKLVTQKEPLNICPPEQVIPYKVARDIVLENPESIAVGVCACRAASPNPCLPPGKQDVCLFIGDPFASFIGEKNPLFRKITQEEAVKVIEDAHKRGDVHCAYFKKDVGNKFFAICNCCDCCCLGIKMWNMLGGMVPIIASSGYIATVSDDCNGCGSCDGTCRFSAITLGDQVAEINVEKCMGCGVCEDVCPIGAIKLVRDPSKGDPLDLDELKKLNTAK
ncbi:MAG: 4Fe-4S binding protein [Dehalococcoidia bacterium]